jgi:hypothetical protein
VALFGSPLLGCRGVLSPFMAPSGGGNGKTSHWATPLLCPHNEQVNFEFLVPLLATAASAVGILVALDQITAVARLRRQVSFWNDLRMNNPLPSDAEAFQSLERAATAKIIAFQALPARKLLFPAFAFIAGISTAWQVGYEVGRIPTADFSWRDFRTAP